MASVSHDVGDAVTVWGVFRNAAREQAAPDTVTLTVRHPIFGSELLEHEDAETEDLKEASEATGQILVDTTGVYKATIVVDASGVWRYAWAGTGEVTERHEGWFDVRRRRVEAPSS